MKKLIYIICLGLISSCAGVGFGFQPGSTKLSPEIKSISITNFPNNTGTGPANLSISFTEALRDYFQRNIKLSQVPSNGDLQLEGQIIGYKVTPVSPSGQSDGVNAQMSELQRLTITVDVKFTNTKELKKDFKQNFSFYQDFPSSKTISDVENELIKVIFDQIVFDVFNKSVANW